jgi:hypothetical protein
VRVLLLLLFALACPAQSPTPQSLPDEVLRLAKLRRASESLFGKLPNITCSLAIERAHRTKWSRKFESLDTVHLEVGLIDGRELYAWPGSKRFEDSDLVEMAGNGGAIGSGDFAIHARNIILSPHSSLKFEREETSPLSSRKGEGGQAQALDGRRLDRWRFHYPIATSEYTIRIPPVQGQVGYSGTLWADSANGDPLRIEMSINEIPAHLPLKSGLRIITYERTTIGNSTYLLPRSSELTLALRTGFESRNRAAFSGCRLYTAESTLSFEDPAPIATHDQPRSLTIPGGLEIHLRPISPIDFSFLAVGDPIQLTSVRDTISGGQVIIPSAARVNGRVMALDCKDTPVRYCLAYLRLESFQSGKTEGVLNAALESPTASQQLTPAYRELDKAGRFRSFQLPVTERPGMSAFFAYRKQWKDTDVSVWRTR